MYKILHVKLIKFRERLQHYREVAYISCYDRSLTLWMSIVVRKISENVKTTWHFVKYIIYLHICKQNSSWFSFFGSELHICFAVSCDNTLVDIMEDNMYMQKSGYMEIRSWRISSMNVLTLGISISKNYLLVGLYLATYILKIYLIYRFKCLYQNVLIINCQICHLYTI